MTLPLPTGWSTTEFNDYVTAQKAHADAAYNRRVLRHTPPYMQPFVQSMMATGTPGGTLPTGWESQEFTDVYNRLVANATLDWNQQFLWETPPYLQPNVIEAMAGYVPPNSTMINFMGGNMPSGAALTRASTGWTINSSKNFASFANDTARFAYDPVTGALRGLLNEPSAINVTNNSNANGAVVGSPGTQPTSWSSTLGAGVTASVVGFATVQGIQCVDIRYQGTPTSGTGEQQAMDSTFRTSIVPGNASESVYLALVGGSLANLTKIALFIANNISNVENPIDIKGLLTPNLQRFSFTGTMPAGCTGAIPRTIMRRPTNQPIDYTLRFGMPLLEQNGPTSSIVTTAGSVTRAADILTLSGIANATYNVTIKRESGTTTIPGVVVSAGTYVVPTDGSPLQSVTFSK